LGLFCVLIDDGVRVLEGL